MSWIVNVLIVVQVVCAGAVIILVLLQHGKGADMGAAFGSGASGSLFGASGSANFLSRSTAVVAAIFFLATIGLAYSATTLRAARGGGVMSTVAPAAPAVPTGSGTSAPAAQQVPQDAGSPAPASAAGAKRPDGSADKSAEVPK
jgi:preprotein translocase subunit SecG